MFLHPSNNNTSKTSPVFFLGFGEAKFPTWHHLRVWEPFLGWWNRDPFKGCWCLPPTVAGRCFSQHRGLKEVPVSLGICENLGDCDVAMFGQVVVEAEIFPRILHCLKAPTADFGGWWMTRWTMNDHQTRGVISTTHQARWWFEEFFIFTPSWGDDPIWLSNIFQIGWFNHQLARFQLGCFCFVVVGHFGVSVTLHLGGFTGLATVGSQKLTLDANKNLRSGGSCRHSCFFKKNSPTWNRDIQVIQVKIFWVCSLVDDVL